MSSESIRHPSADELRPQVSPEHRREHDSLGGGVVAELARERDYRDRDADAVDVAKRGAEKEQRDDRVTLRPSRDSMCAHARWCRLRPHSIALRQRSVQKKDARGKAPASLTICGTCGRIDA